MSESDTDSMNSTVNLRENPNFCVPPEKVEYSPNMSVSGFIDKSPYTEPGTFLQSQWEEIEARTNRFLDRFCKLKLRINEWESSIGNFLTSAAEIHQKYNLLSKTIPELSNHALLVKVSTVIHGDIMNLENILVCIENSAHSEMNL